MGKNNLKFFFKWQSLWFENSPKFRLQLGSFFSCLTVASLCSSVLFKQPRTFQGEEKYTNMSPEPEDENALIPESSAEDLKAKFLYMEKIILASRIIHMWPNIKTRNSFFYHLCVWTMIVNDVSFIASFGVKIKTDFGNMDSVTALIDYLTVFISGTFRYIYIYARGDKYLHLVSLIQNNFIFRPFFPGGNEVSLQKYYNLANRLILSYGLFTILWILQVCTVPFISYIRANSYLSLGSNQTELEPVPYPVIMKVYAPFDYYKQPANILFCVYQFTGLMLFGYAYIVVDAFWYMVILLTIGQLVLIKESLHTIAGHLGTEEAFQVQLLQERQIRNAEAGLKKCIEHHQFIREFILLIEVINNPNVLVDSLHAAISLGFLLLDAIIALNLGDFNRLMYSIGYITTSIVHMLCFDYLANELMEKEAELAEAAYGIPWYKCPSLKVQLLLLMTQSRRARKLTGGKMFQLNLSFFTSMLKAVFSYFTCLFQLRNSSSISMK